MMENQQENIVKELDAQIDHLKKVLEEKIVKNSDAEFDLKDLKLALEDLQKEKEDVSSDKMLVMANEWQEE